MCTKNATAERERAAIVAWLRKSAGYVKVPSMVAYFGEDESDSMAMAYEHAASAIESRAHLTPTATDKGIEG